MAYATVADVQGRLPYRTISATSAPSTSRVQAWLDEGDAALNMALLAAALPAPYSSTDAVRALGRLVASYAEGRTRMAYAAAGGDGSNDDGKDLIEAFEKIVDPTDGAIVRNPSGWGMALGAGSAPESAIFLRAYQTDNADGKSISAGDFRPIFQRGMGF